MGILYRNLIRSALFRFPAETAHHAGISALRLTLASGAARRAVAGRCAVKWPTKLTRFGLNFTNPVGVAAGFDKSGQVVEPLAALGFGFVEVGTVTASPQPGNDKPRLFRLLRDQALINRLGFNNDGAAVVAGRLTRIERPCVIGVNIGKNRDVPLDAATENYMAAFEALHPTADYIAVNVSSPNTENLRQLQSTDKLDELLRALQTRNDELGRKPLLVKIAPDLSEIEIESIVGLCLDRKVDGLIATNTTTSRPALLSPGAEKLELGGLSGRPLARLSDAVIAAAFRYANGRLPIIGVGGIFDARDAFQKIASGASLLQAYTGFVYEGPTFARELSQGLLKILDDRGFATLDEAVGSGLKSR